MLKNFMKCLGTCLGSSGNATWGLTIFFTYFNQFEKKFSKNNEKVQLLLNPIKYNITKKLIFQENEYVDFDENDIISTFTVI